MGGSPKWGDPPIKFNRGAAIEVRVVVRECEIAAKEDPSLKHPSLKHPFSIEPPWSCCRKKPSVITLCFISALLLPLTLRRAHGESVIGEWSCVSAL